MSAGKQDGDKPETGVTRAESAGMFGTPDPERPPTVKGYNVLRKIGDGGMGVVYLAQTEDQRFKRTVAMKIVKRGMDSEEILRRFELERQVLAALNHPNIARLVDGGLTDDGRPYFALEFIEGEPIDHYCDTHRLRTDERLELFSQVCRGVHHAHQNLVVHRDLKPANILVTREGVPKLLDFGIAKLLNPDLSSALVAPTGGGLRLMTPEYASPEQVQGDPISTASDVYSLGVLLYELLSGHRPYQFTTRVHDELVRVICDEDPGRPSDAVTRIEEVPTTRTEADAGKATRTVTPETVSRTREGRADRLQKRLRGDVDNIVLKAMQKAPQRRYSSAEEFAQDIEKHLNGYPVLAQADSVLYRCRKFVRRNRVGVAVAALVVVAALGSGVAALQTARISAARAEELAATERAARIESEASAEVSEAKAVARKEAELRIEAQVFLSDLHDAVFPLVGSTPARTKLADFALDYVRRLKEVAGEDPRLQRELAMAHTRLGEMQFGLRGPHNGQLAAALGSHREALAIRQALYERDRADVTLARDLVDSRVRLGDLLRLDDPQAALDHYVEATGVYEDLKVGDSDDLRLRRRVAGLLRNIAVVRGRMPGGAALAVSDAQRSLDLRRRNHSDFPDDANTRRDLGVGYSSLAYALQQNGQHDEARTLLRENVEIRVALLDDHSTNASLRRDVPIAQWTLARALLHEADEAAAAEAVGLLEEALEQLELLAAEDQVDRRVPTDIVAVLETAGVANLELGRDEAAGEYFGRQFNAAIALHDRDATNPTYQRILGFAHRQMGRWRDRSGNAAEAVLEYRRALELLAPLAEADTEIAETIDVVEAALAELGQTPD